MNHLRRILVAVLVVAASACTGSDDALPTATTDVSVAAPSRSSTTVPARVDEQDVTSGAEVDDAASDTSSPSSSSSSSSSTIPVPGGVSPPVDGGGVALGPLGETDVDVETDAGTVQIGTADVPAGVDPEFPLPDDLDVQLASETPTDLGFSGVTSIGIDALVDFYANELPLAGYTVTGTQLIEGVLGVFTFEGRGQFGQVAISETPGASTTTLLVTLGDGVGQEEDVAG